MLHKGLLIFQLAWALPGGEPFWKAKEKAYARVQQGEVLVVVNSKKDKHLDVNGGGHIQAPRDFVFQESQNFAELPQASSYIEKAQFDAATQKLALVIGAFGYRAALTLKLEIQPGGEPRRIAYEVLEGPVKGMKGAFAFSEFKPGITEVGLTGDYAYDNFKLPQFFVEFGFEVVFQRMAINLRSHVERKYKSTKEQQ